MFKRLERLEERIKELETKCEQHQDIINYNKLFSVDVATDKKYGIFGNCCLEILYLGKSFKRIIQYYESIKSTTYKDGKINIVTLEPMTSSIENIILKKREYLFDGETIALISEKLEKKR